MRKQWMRLALFGAVCAVGSWLTAPTVCQAEVQEGRAVIQNGDTVKAREMAIQDAERTLVEAKVGVQVSSTTLVDKGMVITDRIMSNSNGYVQLNKVLSEHQDGEIYVVSIDADVSSHAIETEMSRLKDKISALSDNASRHGVLVAVAGKDGIAGGSTEVTTYVRGKLEDEGFEMYESMKLSDYVQRQAMSGQPLSPMQVRTIASSDEERMGANSVLYGVFSTISVTPRSKGTVAVVQASFNLVGLDTNTVNSYSDYFSAVGNDRMSAIQKAMTMASKQAVEALARKALVTTQRENRGGQHHLKTLLIFQNITDRNGQMNQVMQALRGMSCRVIRYGFTSSGMLQVFVDAMNYGTPADLSMDLGQRIPGLIPGTTAAGKMTFSF